MLARQLGLFDDGVVVGDAPLTEQPRRVYDHDAIMRERAAAIKAMVAQEYRDHLAMFAAEKQLERLSAAEAKGMPDQYAALFWNKRWCWWYAQRHDCWCVKCEKHSGCPVGDYLLDEGRRVNSPTEAV
jgi:hypothetical protein